MPDPVSIVFFGTPEFALPALRALVDQGYNVKMVVTEQPVARDRGLSLTAQPVDRWATDHGLLVDCPAKLKDNSFLEKLRALSCPIFVLVAYGRILPPQLLAIPRHGVVNVHPSLLPKYRGPAPIISALRNGDVITGVSIMLLDNGMDTGPVLAQKQCPITADDSAASLSERLARMGAELLIAALPSYLAGTLQSIPQPGTADPPTKFITKEDGRAVWSQKAAQLERDCRAFNPWPGLWTIWSKGIIKILACRIVREKAREAPGQVVMKKNKLLVATGEGYLEITQLQLAGRRPLDAPSFLRGQPQIASARFA